MASERMLVTGALGCIGAWTVKRLVDENVQVWTYDLGTSKHRLTLIMDDESLAKVQFLSGDITDFNAFERAVADLGITHIIHLAALQVPFVRADPVLGARVNLVGMANVLEVAKRHQDQLQGLTYASSIAIYGPPGKGFQTASLYGVHKQAKEGMARIYSQDYNLHTIGLRPHTVYGPGRDQGMTSTPTKAMLSAAVGRPYEISFGGTVIMHHADDVAATFIRAVRAKPTSAVVYDMGGNVVTMDKIVEAINAAVPDMAGKITYKPVELPVAWDYETSALEGLIGKIDWTPLKDGVRRTIEDFRKAAENGKIDVERAIA